jgi:hypothetical protein
VSNPAGSARTQVSRRAAALPFGAVVAGGPEILAQGALEDVGVSGAQVDSLSYVVPGHGGHVGADECAHSAAAAGLRVHR